uniref:Uncharacterized protein n=1 Tax=Rhodosorus marinus TaxID=101924 RepID=A0A7S3EDV3_9RHOD|mmetsp:Transcript_28423/g.111476  ORF Transcript_28423/g.111476 Transcript_28423/m.111476 type:complete len:117 (+) Transcript_28423:469-819(+)
MLLCYGGGTQENHEGDRSDKRSPVLSHRTEGQLTGPRVIQELRGFPNIVVETLSGESLKIREKFEDAKATILIMSHPQSGSSTSKDWCSPFKRQFVDHPHVQVCCKIEILSKHSVT